MQLLNICLPTFTQCMKSLTSLHTWGASRSAAFISHRSSGISLNSLFPQSNIVLGGVWHNPNDVVKQAAPRKMSLGMSTDRCRQQICARLFWQKSDKAFFDIAAYIACSFCSSAVEHWKRCWQKFLAFSSKTYTSFFCFWSEFNIDTG